MIDRRSFIIGIKSKKLSSREKIFIKKYKPWGVILFTRNIKSTIQVKKLTDSIKKIFKDKNYPILIDQEGGKVNRLRKLWGNDIFTGRYFGNLYKSDKRKFINDYKIYIKKTSKLLKKIGININTVPVLDIKKKHSSNIIGDRAFSSNPKIINTIGNYCIELFHKNNIGTVIKHIPGHGSAKVDSHIYKPTVKMKLDDLLKNDFYTFTNKKSFFAMTAHVVYQKIDKKFTATHSKKIIKIIRKDICFKGLIITDDISMKALKNSIKVNTLIAFSAGCNLVLHCNGNFKEMEQIGKNSPLINNFIIKKTSQFYKILR